MMADETMEELISKEIRVAQETVSRVLTSSDDSQELLQKVRDYVVEQQRTNEKLRTDINKLRRARVNADQQFNQLEKQFISCNSKLEHELKSNETLKQQLEETSQSLEGKIHKLTEVESVKENAVINYSRVSQLNENLEAEKLNLIATVERKNQEIDRLNGEWKSMLEKVNNASSLQYEAKAKLDELTSKETSYQLREKRLEQEKNLLKKQNEWLDSQLKEKSDAFFALKKEKSSSSQQLQNQLDLKIEEVKNLESLCENLKASNEELNTKVSLFMEKLKDARELQSKTEEQYKLEISSQNKLTMLYKDASDASKNKCNELVSAVEELQNLLKEASSARLEAESKLEENETNNVKSVKEYEEKLEGLQNELRNANDLLEAARQRGTAPLSSESLAALSPTAAATSSFLKSGMTLTQIYNQYVETLDNLQVEKVENTRLKEYLDEILKDIQEKAPRLQQQRKDYETALDTVDRLTEKLEAAMAECERFSLESSEAVSKAEHLKRENERMKVLTADLGNQIKVLLKECEEARGGIVSKDYGRPSDEVSSSSEVISEHLVTFRNIEELQEQNQKLLTVIRELSDEKEGLETMGVTTSSNLEMKKQLNVALEELEELRSARARQVQMVEAVVRQRDMYRVLLSNTGQSPIAPQILEHSLSATSVSPQFKEQSEKNFAETNKALKELQKQFESYKNDRLASEKLLQEKNEEMQSTIAELNIKNSTVSSQLEHSQERYKLLESTCNSFKREAEALRDKSHKLSLSCTKVETLLETTKQELGEVKEKLMKTEVMYENLQQERNILKEAETRLMEENKSLINQHKGQSSLMTNLQTIQNNLERQEYETRTRLTGHIENLEREVTVLKQRLTIDAEHHSNIVESWQSQVKEAKQQLETEMKNHQEGRNQLLSLRSDFDELQTKFSEKESHLSASEARLNEILTRNAEEDQDAVLQQTLQEQEEKYSSAIDKMKEKLSETESRNKIVENQLELAKQHLDQYKAMLAASEDALAELNKTSKLYQEKMEKKQTETQNANGRLQTDLTSTKSRKTELEEENKKLNTKLTEETSKLRQSVNVLTGDLKNAIKRAETCIVNEKRAKEVCEEQTKLAAQAQEKYEKELVHHAADVQALTAAKDQIQTFDTRLQEMRDKWEAAETNLNGSQAALEEQKNMHAKEVENLAARCEELINQNSVLHEQAQKLSQQVLAVQSRSASDIRLPPMTESSEEPDNQSVKDLWEVIRFIRKEKDIAETKNELVQSESVRYQQRLEYVEKQLKETEECLEKERQRSKLSAKDSKEHDEIMEKVAKLGEIEELNKVLTSEKEVLRRRINTTESQMKKLESEIGSLKENIKTLTSQKDMLVGEKTGLRNEIQRWRSRTNQLIEQCKQQPDPEDLKKLQEEKKQLLAQQKTSKDEAQKSKVQVEALRNEITRLQAEINVKKTETAKIQEELNSLKSENTSASSKLQEDFGNLQKEMEGKNEEINEKLKTINQLKRIARRYKTQCDEMAAEKEELKKKLNEEKPAEDNTEQENVIKTLNVEKKAIQDEVERLTQTLTASKEKEEKTKKTLNSATKKIQQLMSLKDKYSNENEELKKTLEEVRQEKDTMVQAANEREMRLTVLSTQFEGKQSRFEKELNEKKEELEKLVQEKEKQQQKDAAKDSEIEKLKKRNQQFQRVLLQAQQKIKSQASLLAAAQNNTSGPSTSSITGTESMSKDLVTSQSANVIPPTAAVKPTATSSTSAPVRPVVTPTASIRPMAMTSAAVQPTPMATVPPTVSTQPTAVAIVSAVSEPITATAVAFRTQSSTTTTTAQTTPPVTSVSPSVVSEVSSSPSVSVRPITSSNVSTVIAMATSSMEENEERPAEVVTSDERPATLLSAQADPPEQSRIPEVASSQGSSNGGQVGLGSKRSRESESVAESNRELEVEAKKLRTDEVEQEEGELSDDEEEVLADTAGEEGAEDDEVLSGADDEQEPDEETGEPEEPEDPEEPEVVCIESDDEDNVKDDIEREIEEEEDDDDVVEVIDDDMDIKAEFDNEGINEEPDGSAQEEISANVRITADSTPSTSNQERRSRETTVTSHSLPSMTQVPLVRSQSHLAPFTLAQSQPGNNNFDDTDDCMVPSTPTLFIPKRSDGFSEMISSPRVHHPSFLFGPSTETNLTQTGVLAMGMSEEGLRVDDTRFDIMASSRDGDDADADLGFDNVVPDLDEAAAIESSNEDDGAEGSSGISSMVTSTSAEQSKKQSSDISEQNVPETSVKYESIEIAELGSNDDDPGRAEEDAEAQANIKLELETVEEGDGDPEIKPPEDEPSTDTSKDLGGSSSRSSTPDPPSSTSGSRIQPPQEGRSKSTVVQLRRPAAQTTTQQSRVQGQAVQASAGRRMIRRVQGRGQTTITTRGNQRRGRGGAPGPSRS